MSNMTLSRRNLAATGHKAGCDCCDDFRTPKPGVSKKARRTTRRLERQTWRDEWMNELAHEQD